MNAHVHRVLAALTVDELWEVRDRIAGFVENATDAAVLGLGEDEPPEQTVDDRSGWIMAAEPRLHIVANITRRGASSM